MARNSYKMNFKDKTIVYSNVHIGSHSCRVIDTDQMEIMQKLFFNLEELTFSCDEEVFCRNTFTPSYLNSLRELRNNEFKTKKL